MALSCLALISRADVGVPGAVGRRGLVGGLGIVVGVRGGGGLGTTCGV